MGLMTTRAEQRQLQQVGLRTDAPTAALSCRPHNPRALSALAGRRPPFDPHVSGENIAAVLVDSVSMASLTQLTNEQDETTTQE